MSNSAPAFRVHSTNRIPSVGLEGHQGKAIKIDRLAAVRPASVEGKTRVSLGGPGNHAVALADSGAHLVPNPLPGTEGILPNINASPHLHEPDAEPAAQTRERILNDHDHHGAAPSVIPDDPRHRTPLP